MSDIFICSSSNDRPWVEGFAKALEVHGWSVWWDRDIPIGGSFNQVIRQKLSAAKCAIVVWSDQSVESEWVHAEAYEAKKQDRYFQIKINDCEIPLGFTQRTVQSLVDWEAGVEHAGFDRLVADITRMLGAQHGEKAPAKPRRQSTKVRAWVPTDEERRGGPCWRAWVDRGVRVVAIAAGSITLLLGAWAMTRLGLDELNASATILPNSALCEAVPGFGPEMILVEGGQFSMGAEAGSASSGQRQAHTVTVKPFAIGTCEVPFEEYDRFAEATKRELPHDYGWGRGRRPVINVSWDDAKAYAAWLSTKTGKRYRLPTDSEWEYAARSGGKDEGWAGTSDESQLKNYAVYGHERTEPVGRKKPNGLGLFDMSGNVWEWGEDCYGEPTKEIACDRVLRGGSWLYEPESLRVSSRTSGGAGYRGNGVGFRLAQDISE